MSQSDELRANSADYWPGASEHKSQIRTLWQTSTLTGWRMVGAYRAAAIWCPQSLAAFGSRLLNSKSAPLADALWVRLRKGGFDCIERRRYTIPLVVHLNTSSSDANGN